MHFQTLSDPSSAQLDALIVPVFKDGSAFSGAPAAERKVAQWVATEQGLKKVYSTATHLMRDGDGPAMRLVVVAAGDPQDYDLERAWRVTSAGMRTMLTSSAVTVGVVLDTTRLDAERAVQAAVEGVHFALWQPESHRTGDGAPKLPPIGDVLLVTGDVKVDGDAPIKRGSTIGEAVNWARTLANEPANLMTPSHVAQAATTLAGETGLEATILEEDDCRKLGMGSFLSVAHGSDEDAKFIVLRHHGRGGSGYDLALVGKGITFDSGGISIKPAADMHLMKDDMSGAAAVIAATGAIARLGLKLNLLCVTPMTENLPGGHATKPGDVFTSMSGKTVEVINTDAEGRLVLVDGVTYVQREGAKRIVDVATLTGAIVVALGQHYTGVFGHPAAFTEEIVHAAQASGERMWAMPLSDEYRDDIKSDIADIKNSAGREGGAIYGAAFIDAVVDADTEWAHLDIAGTGWTTADRKYAPKGPLGVAVRTIVELAGNIAARSR